MADEEEVIVLEEEEPVEKTVQVESDEDPEKEQAKKKRLWLIVGLLALLIILLLLLLVVALRSQKSAERVDTTQLAKKIRQAAKPLATPSQIEQMIKKANILYERGNKKEALDLFEQIATYSASISYYNLGVVQMRQEKYAEAIASFKKAIQNEEHRCISALNAAVCALHLGDQKRFDYYLRMAQAHLPETYGSSLHSYLYTLIQYYHGNFYEILSASRHPSRRRPDKTIRRIAAAGYTLFDRPYRAIDLLQTNLAPIDALATGQLYARVGQYDLAIKYLQEAVTKGDDPIKSRKALALVYLKSGQPRQAATLLERLRQDFGQKADALYPIHARLAKTLYDIDAAQRRYDGYALLSPPTSYKLIFEFAPFKVFNALQTLNYIKKGNAAIYVDESPDAGRYLRRGSTVSKVNLLISRAIKAALDHRLRTANHLLQKALARYPNHAILHYNLGLIYAQQGDYLHAHTHFLRSYHLDTHNLLSGIFALMCEALSQKKIPQVEQFIADDIARFQNPTTAQHFVRALFYFYRSNIAAATDWLKQSHDNRPLYLLLDLLLTAAQGQWDQALQHAKHLRNRLPKDPMANLLYLWLQGKDQPIKRFSAMAQRYLSDHPIDEMGIYHGSAFVRENYIALRHITGTLYPFVRQTEAKLLTDTRSAEGIIETLALGYLYLRSFEKSYTLFNRLIDHFKRQDSRTLFYAAVAAIGAEHHADAVALLQLAKMADPNNNESRFALGLLYLERRNLQAAIIQLKKIAPAPFRSRFFDFDLVTKQ